MKVYILVDMEGISGVNEYDDWNPGNAAHQMTRARLADLMVGESNAAVHGALAAGATTVVVRDGHGWSNTIPIEKLHPAAFLSQGRRIRHPLPDLEQDFAGMVMIGQQAKAGNLRGCLSHTYSRRIGSIQVNGSDVGEIALNAALAGELGVPACFVSGDTEAIQEARSHLDGIVTVETKKSHSTLCTLSRSPATVRDEIAAGVTRALQQIRNVKPFSFAAPVRLQVTYHSLYVNIGRYMLRRQWRWGRLGGPRTIVYRGNSLTEVWRNFIAGA